jgi:hypothetical protein
VTVCPVKKKALIVADSDPRRSAKPAEALRVAAGLAAWPANEITLCLIGPAAELLRLNEDFLGEEDVRSAWGVLGESDAAVFAEQIPAGMATAFPAARTLDREQFARLAAESDCLIRF